MEIRQFFLRRRRLFDVTGQETAAARDRKCPVARLSQRDNTCKYNPAGFHGAFNVSRACGMDIARSCDTCARLYTKFSGPKGKPYRALPDLHARPFPSRESLLPLATSFTGFEITIDRTIDWFLYEFSLFSLYIFVHACCVDPRENTWDFDRLVSANTTWNYLYISSRGIYRFGGKYQLLDSVWAVLRVNFNFFFV